MTVDGPKKIAMPALRILLIATLWHSTWSQVINRAPHFTHGGDMARLAISESTEPGTTVYTLQGEDPEGSKLHYSISGEYFTVNRDTGVVRLVKPVDREAQDLIEVIISITDERVAGSEPNTVSLRREIAVLDENDNPPVYHGRPYAARVPENATVGGLLLPPETIIVTDRDGGINADVHVTCVPTSDDDDACRIFTLTTEKLAEGKYDVQIRLAKSLDYERKNSYLINLVAIDGSEGSLKRLQAKATVAVDILDVQDRPPIFLNAPYSVAIPENTPSGVTVLTIRARDGDSGEPRSLTLDLEDENNEYFSVEVSQEGEFTLGKIITTSQALDREDPAILDNGGYYTFYVRATELIDGEEYFGESATSLITIVVTDVDDIAPEFNEDVYNLRISEDIGPKTPLPGLNMIISDEDLGDNAKYKLELRDAPNYPGVSEKFLVVPNQGQGRISVVIQAKDDDALDYDIPEDINKELEFEVAAVVNEEVISYATVHIELIDANDNSPQFSQSIYKLTVPEDAEINTKFSDARAYDRDSGEFGKLAYSIRGFGSDKFSTDQLSGGIYIAKPLDYESQRSYSLTMEAKDGGGKISSASLLIEVEDVNDNKPVFELKEYSRIIREGATSFDPQLFVRAIDVDGPMQGNGKVTYTLYQHNSTNNNVFKINPDTGEILIGTPVKSGDTERGVYELIVRATDHGYPPSFSEVKIFVRVGVPGNQKPIFRGNFKSTFPGPSAYKARILETAEPGTEVIRVIANDPDGRDSLLKYEIASGAKDNFLINSSSGIMTVSPDARLDLDNGGSEYKVVVYAVDSGVPVRETATTTVTITIVDVNNKPPVFSNGTYIAYVSERAQVGKPVISVSASDPDSDSSVGYSIIEPIRAMDKTGVAVKPNLYDYRNAFRINSTTGTVYVNRALDYQTIAVVILTIEASDLNAATDPDQQVARAELTIYIQAYSDDNPTFTNNGWSPNNPIVRITVAEEQPVGTILLTLSAKEPMTGYAVQRFEMVRESDDDSYVNVGAQSGNVILSKRLDYESLDSKTQKFKVRALTRDYDITRRMSEATVIIDVQDLNDNSPTFAQSDYKISILESEKPSKVVLMAKASDLDSSKTEEEIKRGYGVVRYGITGENANLFSIESTNGNIRIAPNTTLDREKQSVLHFYVIAFDIPHGGADQKSSRASVTVDVLDVNDNAPTFPQSAYTAVIPENAPVGTSVINVTASDPDEGAGGTVHFEFMYTGEVNGLFKINRLTGEITSVKELTGKGRTEPYHVKIRAQDGGDPIMYSDADLTLYIGDVVSNDGVPLFIRPTLDEVAHVLENATIGSQVFQVVASDPDDPNLPNGKITFRFLEDGNTESDSSAFRINRETGLITTNKLLDRESKDSYTLILVAQDLGDPPQQATRILQVSIGDVDDHKPHFKRSFYSSPLEFVIDEEVPKGTVVGTIEATDEDIGDNGKIDYLFINGNEAGLFSIKRFDNNTAVINVAGKLDRESDEKYLLTVKCVRYSSVGKSENVSKPYNRQDPSERQILIRILDIDDNLPIFTKENITRGVRVNVPIDTSIITLEASDRDCDAHPIVYKMGRVAFISLVNPSMSKRDVESNLSLNPNTGEIRTIGSLARFADGYLEVPISANNSKIPGREARAILHVFLVRDRDMLKFVFSKPPIEVRKRLESFERAVAKALLLPVTVNIYDTQFYTKDDNSLDFSSTSSCFQIFGKESYRLRDMKVLLTDQKNEELKKIYKDHHVEKVTNCALVASRTDASKTQIWVLFIAILIGVSTVASSCTLCFMHMKFKRRVRHARLREQSKPTLSYVSSPRIISAGSHTTLGPGTMMSNGLHDGPFEWGHSDTILYHPSTLSRT